MDIVTTNEGDPIDKCLCSYIHEGDVIVIRKYNSKLYCTVIPETRAESVLRIKAGATDDIITIQNELLAFKSEKGVELEITKTL